MSTTDLLQGKGRNAAELSALEVAEDAREQNWEKPSFMADLFMGKVDEASLFPYPFQEDADRKIGDALLQKVQAFMDTQLDGELIDKTGEIPPSVMKGLAELGMFGMKIPKEFGGLGLSQTNYLRVLALISTRCASTTAMLSAHQSIGVPQPLLHFGTPEQKQKYLPRLAKGSVSAFALTEPGVGSDPAQMTTFATPSEDGTHFILNGLKLWCTNGAIAETMVVMCRTPSITVNGKEKKQISAFIVERSMPGIEIVHRCRFHGLNGIQNALIRFTNVKVPRENLLWGLGKGLRLALITLNAGRLGIPAACVGSARQLLTYSRQWGTEREQWGAAIGKHESGASKIGELAASLFAMESMTDLFASWVDRKSHDVRLEAAMAKVYCSERSHRLIDQGVQLRGGRGYEQESSLKARGEHPWPLERALRDSRINQIVEGTSEILRLFIAREALDRHLKLAGQVLNPKAPLGVRFATLIKAGAYYSAWYPWQWVGAGLARGRSILAKLLPSKPLESELQFARAQAHRLARTLFHLMLLNGPKLEKRQLQLCRIVDVSSELMATLATISRARGLAAQKRGTARSEILTATLFCRQSRLRMNQSFKALSHNADALERQVAASVLKHELKPFESHWDEAAALST